MSKQSVETCDVLIIGAGMAGSCLARQIRLQQPDLRVVNIDRRTEFSYWIGESTVEAWEDYVGRALGLDDFLQENFPEKNGLRMFWDSPDKDLPLHEMSEFGRSDRHPHPARHLDRVKFDTAMAEINRASGVDVRLGVSVPNPDGIVLDPDNGHLVQTSAGPIRCRYLVDAAGRGSPLARKLDLVPVETRHRSASYWARIRGLRPMDQLGDDAWRARVNNRSRFRSTNHFMYDGYWFWFIALDDDVVSVGVEYNRDRTPLPVQTRDELMAFLRSHRCLDELLGPDAEVLDFMGWINLPRCARQHFSRDRWYLAGMSGFFVDVLGSGTSRIYSECNRLIGELIRTDRAGDTDLLERELDFFNLHMRASYEAFLKFLHHYDWFGSFDLFSTYFGAGLAIYFNSALPHNISDLSDTIQAARASTLRLDRDFDHFFQTRVLSGPRAATERLAGEAHALLRRSGAYYAGNQGRFSDSLDWEARPDIADKISLPRDRAAEVAADLRTWRMFVRRLLEALCRAENIPFSEACFDATLKPSWTSGQRLEELLEAQRAESQLDPTQAAAQRGPASIAEVLEPSTF